jgi:hypothetical protein
MPRSPDTSRPQGRAPSDASDHALVHVLRARNRRGGSSSSATRACPRRIRRYLSRNDDEVRTSTQPPRELYRRKLATTGRSALSVARAGDAQRSHRPSAPPNRRREAAKGAGRAGPSRNACSRSASGSCLRNGARLIRAEPSATLDRFSKHSSASRCVHGRAARTLDMRSRQSIGQAADGSWNAGPRRALRQRDDRRGVSPGRGSRNVRARRDDLDSSGPGRTCSAVEQVGRRAASRTSSESRASGACTR